MRAKSRKWLGCFSDPPVGSSSWAGKKDMVVADVVCSCGGSRGAFLH